MADHNNTKVFKMGIKRQNRKQKYENMKKKNFIGRLGNCIQNKNKGAFEDVFQERSGTTEIFIYGRKKKKRA